MRRTGLTILASAALLAGCGGQTVDKAGGKGGDVRILRLANANDEPGELAAYAREVKRLSGGRLRIEFANNWRRGPNDAEPGILDDIRAGKVDLAWVGARAFKAEGVKAFDALIAPFQVTDYDTEQRVLTDPIARNMLAAVDRIGVKGVALLPGPLRRLGMRKPWSGPHDLKDKRIGAPAGIGSAAIKALGAVPVVHGSGAKLTGLDGTEQHLPSFVGNRYMHEIPNVASQPLWPRPLVVIASPGAWKALAADDRKLLLKAGTTVLRPMLDDIRAADRAAVPKLCRAGARFFEADLPALRAAAAPVIDALRRDAASAPVLRAVERERRDPAPIICPKPAQPAKARGGLPSGEYTWTLTLADGRTQPGGKTLMHELPDVFRAVVTPGRLVIYVSSKGKPEEIGFEEDYSVFKDRIIIGGNGSGRFKVDGKGNLHFSDIKSGDPSDEFVFETKPWKRVR